MVLMRKLALVLLLPAACGSPSYSPDQTPAVISGDPFLGNWSRGLLGEQLSIQRDGVGYRLSGSSYDYLFVPDGEGRLSDKDGVLGTITSGTVEFRDRPNQYRRVLRLEFCYEHFVLYDTDFARPRLKPE